MLAADSERDLTRASRPSRWPSPRLTGRGVLRLAVLRLPAVLALRLVRLALLLPPPPPRLARGLLRSGEVVGERVGDLLHGADPLANAVDQALRGRRVRLCRREQRSGDVRRLLEGDVDEPRGVLLVPVAAGVRERAEEPLGLREVGARAAVLQLARCPGEAARSSARRCRPAPRPSLRRSRAGGRARPGRGPSPTWARRSPW